MMVRAHSIRLWSALLGLAFVLYMAACGGSSSNLANTGGISGTGDISKPVIADINTAHATYGTRQNNLKGDRQKSLEFTLSSLAPVFTIAFTESFDMNLTDFIQVSYAKADGQPLNKAEDNIVTRRSSDGKTHFIMIMKSGRVEIAEQELHPGQDYILRLQLRNAGNLVYLDKSSPELNIAMKTRVMTFTYPMEVSSTDSLVNLGLDPFGGVNSTTPEFIVHSKYPIVNYNPNDLGYGIVDQIDVQLNGKSIFKSGLDRIQVWNASAESFKFLVLPQAGLVKGSTYNFSVAPGPSLKMNVNGQMLNVTQQDLPQQLTLFTKP